MSTNYYFLREVKGGEWVHVGKRSSIGNGQTKFAWDTHPQQIYALKCTGCGQRLPTDMKVIESHSSGEVYTIQEFFRDVVGKCKEEDYTMIGTDFR